MNADDAKWRVCHFPQIPCKAFEVECDTLEQAEKVSDVLALYDIFQFENKIKPDYSNSTYIEFSHPGYDEGEWTYYDPEYDKDMFY